MPTTENQQPEQPEMFAADFLPGARAGLGRRSPPTAQDQRQRGIDQMIGHRMQHGREHHGDEG